MEETPVTPTAETQPATGCANCGNPAVLHGYPTALCSECREHFIRFPVPKWLWLFAGAIGLIVLFSLFTLPRNISVGVALEKGIKAEKQHRYLTAQKEFETVVKKEPVWVEGNGHLMIAAFYNEDFKTMMEAYNKLKGRKIDDNAFVEQLNDLVTRADGFFPDDSLHALYTRYASLGVPVPDTAVMRYAKLHTEDIYTKAALASAMLEAKHYNAADSVVKKLLETNPVYTPALNIGAALHREMKDYEVSLAYCDRLLDINRENTYAIASKARTYLKMKNDQEGMRLALKAAAINEKDGYAIATLAVAYHFAGDTKKRDELLHRYQNDSTVASYMEFAHDVISNKTPFRD